MDSWERTAQAYNRRCIQVTRIVGLRYNATGAKGARRTEDDIMPIDLAQVDWLYVVLLAVFAYLATLIGNLLSFGHRGISAVLSAVAFAAIFVAWTYYPHHLPLPIAPASQKAPATTVVPAAPAAPIVPQRPRNPITDITPPATPQ